MVCKFESRLESAWVQSPTAETRLGNLSDAREGAEGKCMQRIVPFRTGGSRQVRSIPPRQVPLSKDQIANAVFLALHAEVPVRVRERGLASRRDGAGHCRYCSIIMTKPARRPGKACVNAPLAGARRAGHSSWLGRHREAVRLRRGASHAPAAGNKAGIH